VVALCAVLLSFFDLICGILGYTPLPKSVLTLKKIKTRSLAPTCLGLFDRPYPSAI